MADAQNTELFESTPIPKAVLTLGIPTVISSLVMVIYNMADTYFVGMLNNSIQNSAVTLAAPVLLAFNAVNNLFGVGASSMMSRSLGAHDYDTVRKSSAIGFYCALASGVLFSLLVTLFRSQLLVVLGADATTIDATAQYLFWTTSCGAAPAILNVVMAYMVRSEGASLHASIGTMSGCILNMILDPIFILPWGLNMGAAGAGCATFISNCMACVYFFVLLFVKRGKTYISLNPSLVPHSGRIILGICVVGVPAAIQNLLNVTGMTVLNNFTAAFKDTDAIAAMGIVQKVNMIPLQVTFGLSQGIMPLVSYNYASGNVKRMKDTLIFDIKIAAVFLIAVTTGYYVFAGGLVSLFMDNPAVVAYGARFLRGFCLCLPFLCLDFLAVGVFQACGWGQYALLFAILRKLVLEIPALFILNYLFPLYGLAYAQPVAELVLAAAAVAMLVYLFRRMEREGAPLPVHTGKK